VNSCIDDVTRSLSECFSRDVPVKEGQWCGYPPARFDSCEGTQLSVQKKKKSPKHGELSYGKRAQDFRASENLGTCVFGLFIKLFHVCPQSLVGNFFVLFSGTAGGPLSFFPLLHPRTSG